MCIYFLPLLTPASLTFYPLFPSCLFLGRKNLGTQTCSLLVWKATFQRALANRFVVIMHSTRMPQREGWEAGLLSSALLKGQLLPPELFLCQLVIIRKLLFKYWCPSLVSSSAFPVPSSLLCCAFLTLSLQDSLVLTGQRAGYQSSKQNNKVR